MLTAWKLQMWDLPLPDDGKTIDSVFSIEARIALLWLPSMKE